MLHAWQSKTDDDFELMAMENSRTPIRLSEQSIRQLQRLVAVYMDKKESLRIKYKYNFRDKQEKEEKSGMDAIEAVCWWLKDIIRDASNPNKMYFHDIVQEDIELLFNTLGSGLNLEVTRKHRDFNEWWVAYQADITSRTLLLSGERQQKSTKEKDVNAMPATITRFLPRFFG
jgi:hypothetical protein